MKAIQSLNKITAHKNLIFVTLFLFFVSIIYRFPFWFIDAMNWDESTFIIMGKSILDGNFLYYDFWDLKPPLAFLSVSAIMALLGESIYSVRFLGAFSVFISSLLVYLIGRKLFNPYLSLLLGFLCIPMMSIYFSGQSTLTEHLAMPFILSAFYISLKKKNISIKSAMIIGLLISLASMVRLNMAYISIPMGIIIMIYSNRSTILGKIGTLTAYAFSGLLPVFILIAFYTYHGEFDLLFNSMIVAPFSYSTEQKSIFQSLLILTYYFIKLDGFLYISFKFVMFFTALIGVIILLLKLHKDNNHKLIKLLVFSLAIIFSVLSSGGAFRHYLIQLSPVVVIFTGFFLEKLNDFKYINYFFILTIFFFLALDSEDELSQYKSVYSKIIHQEPVKYGYGYWAKEEINKLDLCDYSLYAMSHHIVYFLLDKKPPSPIVTHPSNISKDFIIKALYDEHSTPNSELKKIMLQEPSIILKHKNLRYLENYPNLSETFKTYLDNYFLYSENDNLQIYLRMDLLENNSLCM